MNNKNVSELFELLESGEVTEEMLIKEVSSKIAYCILMKRIERCIKNNDICGALNVHKSLFVKAMTMEMRNELREAQVEATSEVSRRIRSGQLTPMMLDSENKFTGYLHYYYYLERNLCKENPQKARKMADEVCADILLSQDTTTAKRFIEKYDKLFE